MINTAFDLSQIQNLFNLSTEWQLDKLPQIQTTQTHVLGGQETEDG